MKFKLKLCNKITEGFDFQDVDILDDGSFVDLEGRPIELQKTDAFSKSGPFADKADDDIVDIKDLDKYDDIPLDWKQKTDLNNARSKKSNKGGSGGGPNGSNGGKSGSDSGDEQDKNKNDKGTGSGDKEGKEGQADQSNGAGKVAKQSSNGSGSGQGGADIFKLFNDNAEAASGIINKLANAVTEALSNVAKEDIDIADKINDINDLVQKLKDRIEALKTTKVTDDAYEGIWDDTVVISQLIDKLSYNGTTVELSDIVTAIKSYKEPLENVIKNVQIDLLDQFPQYCPLIQDDNTGEFYVQIGDDWIRWDDYYAI